MTWDTPSLHQHEAHVIERLVLCLLGMVSFDLRCLTSGPENREEQRVSSKKGL